MGQIFVSFSEYLNNTRVYFEKYLSSKLGSNMSCRGFGTNFRRETFGFPDPAYLLLFFGFAIIITPNKRLLCDCIQMGQTCKKPKMLCKIRIWSDFFQLHKESIFQ